mgnify:CR=1 FL=1
MLQILKIFEYSPTWHTYIEASKLAFADRNYYIADSDFVDTPGRKLLADEYIKNRYQQIGNEILHNPSHGLVGMRYQNNANGLGPEERGTTHISIVDMEGNILSMTSTIESSFGSKLMSNGYLLNNELTDFSFLAYDKNGKKIAGILIEMDMILTRRSQAQAPGLLDPSSQDFRILLPKVLDSKAFGHDVTIFRKFDETDANDSYELPVSYTHLTLPTIYSV